MDYKKPKLLEIYIIVKIGGYRSGKLVGKSIEGRLLMDNFEVLGAFGTREGYGKRF